jgi:glycosyltransferase involved in cell wall biosynthesis
VVAVPSLVPETFGLSAAEAMARGIPTLVSDIGNLPRVVGNRAQIIPAHDRSRWAEAIAWIASSRERRLELGRAGRSRIQELFDPTIAARRLEEVYETAMRDRQISQPRVEATAIASAGQPR